MTSAFKSDMRFRSSEGQKAAFRQPVADPVLRPVVVTTILVSLGTALGFLRDLMMASLFGANGSTDAFLVAWTVPETVSPLLVEDAMPLLMIPIFARLIEKRQNLRRFLMRTGSGMCVVLAVLALLSAWRASSLVSVLAPGLSSSGMATQCVRLTSITVFTFGVAGFLSAALRAFRIFGPSASLSIAYNVGILGVVLGFHADFGVVSAALGVVCGSLLMSVILLPPFLKCADLSRGSYGESSAEFGAVAPVVIFTVMRQAQVFIERFLGSSLPPGSISHLNYAQKVAQVPVMLALVIVTVTFPRLARDFASGNGERVRVRIESSLIAVGGLVILAMAYVIAFAPPIIKLLFEHGEFTAADTYSTAAIMRLYTLGLAGQAFVGTLGRAFFADGSPKWRPVFAMVLGLVVNAVLGAALVCPAGVLGIAGANAAGITASALTLLIGLGPEVSLSLRQVGKKLAVILLAGGTACCAGLLTAYSLHGTFALTAVALGAVVVLVVYVCIFVGARFLFHVELWNFKEAFREG